METIKNNSDTLHSEESKQNFIENNSQEDTTLKAKKFPKTKKAEDLITLSDGKTFSKQRYQQIQAALGNVTSLKLPDGLPNDGSDGYKYFWASTQFNGQIEQKQILGYEICTDSKNKEYRHFAGIDNNIKHEHVLMRISKADRDFISQIQIERKLRREVKQITENLDPKHTYENKERLAKDGELTFIESLQNKYNNNQTKQF